MAEKKDDPREVLSLLNSLGFVGITAQQLKAFMKDLKMHRKIKERERQEWKDEAKRKILLRQKDLYREVLQEHKMESMSFGNATESTISSESSTFQDDSSYKVVTVKIRCVPKGEKENEENDENFNGQRKKTASFKKTHTSWAEEFRQNSLRYDDNGYNTSSSSSVHEALKRFNPSDDRNTNRNHSAEASTDSTKYISLEKPRKRASGSEQRLKQSNLATPKSPTRVRASSSRQPREGSENLRHGQSTDDQQIDVPSNPPPSRSSVHSKAKSFIRPWRLQPESHRSSINTKSDPVALYQKYRDEWKQLALPGEENHAGIRWAVREKMLGIDPNPRSDVEITEEMIRNLTTNSYNSRVASEREELKMYRRKSRKIRKRFFNRNCAENISKPVFTAGKKRYKYFKSISESLLVRSKISKLCGTDEAQSPQSVLPFTHEETRKLKGIEIERNFNAESISYRVSSSGVRDFQSKEFRSEVTSAKQTLGRLVNKLLNKDIESYAETYKYIDKCCCILRTKEYEKVLQSYKKL